MLHHCTLLRTIFCDVVHCDLHLFDDVWSIPAVQEKDLERVCGSPHHCLHMHKFATRMPHNKNRYMLRCMRLYFIKLCALHWQTRSVPVLSPLPYPRALAELKPN